MRGAKRAQGRKHLAVGKDSAGQIAVKSDALVLGPAQFAGLAQELRLHADPDWAMKRRFARISPFEVVFAAGQRK